MGVMYTGAQRDTQATPREHHMPTMPYVHIHVVHAVCKEKERSSWVFLGFRLLMEFAQLWLLVVDAPQYQIPSDALWWRVVSFVGLDQFMAGRVRACASTHVDRTAVLLALDTGQPLLL
jgi:hypothetical protein